MNVLLTMLGMWAVTFAARYTGLSLGKLKLSPFWLAFLRFVPISVLTALIVPDVARAPDWPLRLLACVVASALLWRTRSLAWGIVGGFGVYWALKQLSGNST